MLYNQVPQTMQVAIQGQVYPCDHARKARFFRVPWGQQPQAFMQSGAGGVLTLATSGKAGFAPNLLSCAMCVYVYVGGGLVQRVALFHAHTGDIPQGHTPLDPPYFLGGTNVADIHVVFASSQDTSPNLPNIGIETAANGLATLLNAGILLANIRVLLLASNFGANIEGDVGMGRAEAFLGADFGQAVTLAVTAAAPVANQVELLALQQLLRAAQGLAMGLTTSAALGNSLGTVLQSLNAFTPGSPYYLMVSQLYTSLIGNPVGVLGPGNIRTWGQRIVDAMKQGA